MKSSLRSIYKTFPVGSPNGYPNMLRSFLEINAGLKRDGILAPSEASLINTKRLYELVGSPLDAIPTIHVGGTNGKGTTCYKVAECLRLSGFRTGLFVSPHLASIRERAQVNSELIPEASFMSHLTSLFKLCVENEIPSTQFELEFLMSALHFRESGCDAVVLEVGVGGEYDATNVVSTAVSVIASVGLDHTRILGSTVELIAEKKAGIFKRGIPALVGPEVPMEVVRAAALKHGAVLYSYLDACEELAQAHPSLAYLKAFDSVKQGLSLDNIDDLNSDLALLVLYLLKKHLPINKEHNKNSSSTSSTSSADTFIESEGSGSKSSRYLTSQWTALDLSSSVISLGLNSRPPCRWERHMINVAVNVSHKRADDVDDGAIAPTTVIRVPVEVILDMGHNPPAFAALAKKIQKLYANKYSEVEALSAVAPQISSTGNKRKHEAKSAVSDSNCSTGNDGHSKSFALNPNIIIVHVLCAFSRDKDIRACVSTMCRVVPVNNIHFVQSSNFRAVPIADLNAIISEEAGGVAYENLLYGSGRNSRNSVKSEISSAGPTDGSNSNIDSIRSSKEGSGDALNLTTYISRVCEIVSEQAAAAAVAAANSTSHASSHSSSSSSSSSSLGLPAIASPLTLPHAVVVICGTGYIMPEARAFLGVTEPRDAIDLMRADKEQRSEK